MCIYVVIILCGILNYHVFWPLREFCYFDMIISVVSVVRFDVGITYYMKAYDNIFFSSGRVNTTPRFCKDITKEL